MDSTISWILRISGEELGHKGRVLGAIQNVHKNSGVLTTYITEIQHAIDYFNTQKGTDFTGQKYFINATHLASIFDQPLPSYQETITTLHTNDNLFQQVIDELKNSSYFREVYEIADDGALFHNLLILYYRTTLLFLHPILREKGAQISSTLEEMSSAMALNGLNTHLFEATKHWIMNWKEEGFAEELAEKLQEKLLLKP